MHDTTPTRPARGPILLSTGRTIAHRREPNGSQLAYVADCEHMEMTHAEWDEYCEIIKASIPPRFRDRSK